MPGDRSPTDEQRLIDFEVRRAQRLIDFEVRVSEFKLQLARRRELIEESKRAAAKHNWLRELPTEEADL